MAAKKKTTREYDIRFIRKGGEEGEETRRIRAADRAEAERRLKAPPDLQFLEIIVLEIKAVRGTARDADDDQEETPPAPPPSEPRPNRIADRLAKAEEFTDGDDRSTDDGEATPEPPEGFQWSLETGPDKLTRIEWEILRECVPLDENDADNGKRLLKWFGNSILHIQEQGWHVWTGTHWDAELGQHAVERAAQKIVARIKREAALISLDPSDAEVIAEADEILEKVEGDKKQLRPAQKAAVAEAEEIKKNLSRARSGRFNWGVRSGDRARTKAMIDQAEPHRSVLPADLDQDDSALNVINGTVRIGMAQDPESDPDDPRWRAEAYLEDHNPDDLFTKIAGTDFDPKATAPHFLADLERFQPDQNMRDFLQVAMGYVVFGWAGEQIYMFFYGDGQNWKSAFLQAIARTVGTYYKPMNYTSVSGNNMPTGDKPSPDWARLAGVRLLTIEEVPKKEPIKEELVKLVTSGTPLPVRHLNKGMFDLEPKFTCIMTSNAEPNISGHDRGIWRRTLIVPWDVVIPDDERLPFNQVMARYDQERAGILNWLIEGACKYRDRGLQGFVTQRMRDFTDSVRADRDAAGSFIADCVKHSEGKHVNAGDLYKAFVKYCQANGIDPILNSTAFGRQVKRCDVEGVTMERRKHKVQGVRRFNDIELHDIPEGDQPKPTYAEMRG